MLVKLVNTVLALACYSIVSLGTAAPLAQPKGLNTKQFIDNPRFSRRSSVVPIAPRDDADSVRITGDRTEDTPWGRRTKRDDDDTPWTDDTPWGRRTKRDDRDSVRVTGGDTTEDTPWG